jgi:hypothetical protein
MELALGSLFRSFPFVLFAGDGGGDEEEFVIPDSLSPATAPKKKRAGKSGDDEEEKEDLEFIETEGFPRVQEGADPVDVSQETEDRIIKEL